MSESLKEDCPVRHVGNLEITANNAEQFALLEEVTGSIYILADAQLPVLATVGGSLYIHADAQLPVLATVGGYLYIGADAQLPVLATVGGYLKIFVDAQLPVLATVGGSLYIHADAQLPVLETVGGSLYIHADGIKFPSLRIAHGVEGRLVAIKEWGLWYSKEFKFYAGCKGPLTKLKALALSHTYGDQEVAQYFAAAIKAIDDQQQVAD